MRFSIAAGATLWLHVACSACPSQQKSPPREEPAAVEPENDASAGDIAEISEARVRGAVDAWLAAQNEGDLPAYAALYASDFTGIKRAGDRKNEFTRKKWLADRARMFKKTMKVTAERLVIEIRPDSAIARFDQTWSSGSYTDFGPKELILRPGSSGLKIVREELLSSEVLSSKRLVAKCTGEAAEREDLAGDATRQLVVARSTRRRKEEACDIVDVTICLTRGDELIDLDEIEGECAGACTPEEVAEGERTLAELRAEVEAGEPESVLDYDFTGCRFEGVDSSEFRQAGGRTWALLGGQVSGPHDVLYSTFRLATVSCDALFVSREFGGWPMQFGTEALTLESKKGGRVLVVSVDKNAHAFSNKKLYELELGADECVELATERVLTE